MKNKVFDFTFSIDFVCFLFWCLFALLFVNLIIYLLNFVVVNQLYGRPNIQLIHQPIDRNHSIQTFDNLTEPTPNTVWSRYIIQMNSLTKIPTFTSQNTNQIKNKFSIAFRSTRNWLDWKETSSNWSWLMELDLWDIFGIIID
jgi:hypothetical protein